jgi:hypothetical protein
MTNEEHLARYGRVLDVHRITPGSPYTVDGCLTLCRCCHAQCPKRRPGEPDHTRPGRANLNVFIRPGTGQAIRAYLASTDPRVSKTSAVESALISFLEDKGFWPPPAGQG